MLELDECLKAIRIRNEDNEERIKYLEEENRKLKEENNKDEEIQKMQERLDKMQKDYWRGFPISEEEKKEIEAWKKKHEEEVHGIYDDMKKWTKMGTIGASYRYCFLPTSIGVSGEIVCPCGAKFEFQEIG